MTITFDDKRKTMELDHGPAETPFSTRNIYSKQNCGFSVSVATPLSTKSNHRLVAPKFPEKGAPILLAYKHIIT